MPTVVEDFIFIVDNSEGMRDVNQALPAALSRLTQELKRQVWRDYRIILISRYGSQPVGDSDYPICIENELGGEQCDPDGDAALADSARFFHYSADIRSGEIWCRLLEGFASPDELSTDAERSDWKPVAPAGWGSLLRAAATKTFVTISDSGVHCGAGLDYDGDYRDVGGQPFAYSFNDDDSAEAGQEAAVEFNDALRELAGNLLAEFLWHSIVAVEVPSRGHTAGIVTEPCSTAGSAAGTGYQALSFLNNGMVFSMCQPDILDILLQNIASYQIIEEAAPCEFRVPELAGDVAWEKTTLTLVHDGEEPITGQLISGTECVEGGWFYGNDFETVVLCPQTCDLVQEWQTNFEVTVTFPCSEGCP